MRATASFYGIHATLVRVLRICAHGIPPPSALLGAWGLRELRQRQGLARCNCNWRNRSAGLNTETPRSSGSYRLFQSCEITSMMHTTDLPLGETRPSPHFRAWLSPLVRSIRQPSRQERDCILASTSSSSDLHGLGGALTSRLMLVSIHPSVREFP